MRIFLFLICLHTSNVIFLVLPSNVSSTSTAASIPIYSWESLDKIPDHHGFFVKSKSWPSRCSASRRSSVCVVFLLSHRFVINELVLGALSLVQVIRFLAFSCSPSCMRQGSLPVGVAVGSWSLFPSNSFLKVTCSQNFLVVLLGCQGGSIPLS